MLYRKFITARTAALPALAGVLIPALALGHHGWSEYTSDDFSLEGTVVEKDFGNPHDRLVVEADGERWNMLLSPPRRSRRAGLDDSAIGVGDQVTAHGHRHRETATLEMKTERIDVGGQTYNLYPERS